MGTIYHIVPRAEWEMALKKGVYEPESLATEGFIHCSTRAQVVGTANFLFKGQQDLILLHIEEEKLETDVIYEDLYQAGKLFPHIYSPLKTAHVSRLVDFPCRPDGTFQFPTFS